MKKFLLLALMMVGISASAQVISRDLVDESFSSLTLKQVERSEDGVVKSVSTYLYFQNREYEYITDLKFIWFDSQEDVESFITDLQKMINLPKGTEARLGKFTTYDFAPNAIYISAQGGYTSISRSKASLLIARLNGIKV